MGAINGILMGVYAVVYIAMGFFSPIRQFSMRFLSEKKAKEK